MPRRPGPRASGAMKRLLLLCALLVPFSGAATPWAQTRTDDVERKPSGTAPAEAEATGEAALPRGPSAVLQGLDKITARISTIEAPLNETARFGSLEIVPRSCHKTPPEEPPERAAFLEIVDARPDSPPVPLFSGWMFASSPAVSALEHPVYDVWVIDCRNASTPESEVIEGN